MVMLPIHHYTFVAEMTVESFGISNKFLTIILQDDQIELKGITAYI